MRSHLVGYSPDGANVDAEAAVLTDYEVLPRQLARVLRAAAHVEIDDPLSFPFEDAGPALWEAPLLVRIPDIAFDECVVLFEDLLFRKLTVCDFLAAPDSLVEPLCQRYGFGRSMFVQVGHRPDRRTLETSTRVAEELLRRRSTLYTEWPLPTVAYKSRLLQADKAVRRAIEETPGTGTRRPRIELHGWHVRRLIPAAWTDLIRVVERRPIALSRLKLDYGPSAFELVGAGAPIQPLATDIGVGVDHLRQSSDRAIERGLSLLFGSVQVGGRLVLLETFDGAWSPERFVDLLLDVSTHRLVLQDLQITACRDDEASTTAVFVLTKIGKLVRA